MKFRKELNFTRVALGLALAALMLRVVFNFSIQKALEFIPAAAMGILLGYGVQYWEIFPDRLIHRNFWLKKVLLFADITCVGPVEGPLSGIAATRRWIVVRGSTGRPMVAKPADCNGFIAEMRKFLPRVTHDLPA